MKLKLLIVALFCSVLGWGQVTIFSENMGSPGGTTAIASNVFQNSGTLTYSGTADVRATLPSTGYAGASANGNVFITNTSGIFFEISGINTSAYTSLVLTFGQFKSGASGAANLLVVEVSSDGTTYNPLTYSRADGAVWALISPTGTIPSTSNLRIRFRNPATTQSFRVDDVVLRGTLASTNTITTDTAITGSPFCVSASTGATVSVPFTSVGTFNAGNIYTAQLSNAAGSFASPVSIGTVTSTANSGTIAATIPAGTAAGTGYRIRVVSSNPTVFGTNNTVDLTVQNSATITAQPSTTVQNLCQGNSATALSVTATGTTLSYQWYSNTTATTSGGTPVGTNSNSYTPVTTTAGTLYYYCVVTAACGASVTSNVSGAVNVTAIPSAPSGTINVSANPSCGAATLTYSAPNANIYWQNTSGGMSTANPTTSSFTSLATAGTYIRYVRELNGTCWGPATSVTFTVVAPVNITGQPTNQSATTGNTATFSVTASNAVGYQWQVNTGSGWANIGGATSASYTTPAATLAMNGYQYQVIVTGNTPCGNVTSSAATLSVTTGPCLSENFNSNTLPAGWLQNGGTTFTGGEGVFGPQNCDLSTLVIAYPSNLTFDLRRTNNTNAKIFYVEVSTTTQSGTYTTIATYDHSNTTSAGTTSCTVDLSAYSSFPSIYIKFRKVSSTTSPWYLDNMSVFCATPPSGPEINITGNNITILDNDTTPSTADGTSFGSTVIGTPIIKTFTIHNQGTTNLVLSGPVTLTDVSAPQEFVISQPAITTIPAGGSTTFTVTFNSAVAGTFTNTINIGSNDTDEALYNFDIIATAYAPSATGTVFRPGDLIFVGYDSTVSAAADCSGVTQMDKLYVANLVDILPGTEFMVVNSRYESGAAANVRTDRWYSGSTDPYDDPGIITFKWNGVAPIVAGSIITFKANVFTVSDIRINDVVTTDFGVTTNANQCNISSTESDQIYIMQGTFTPFGTIGTNRYNLFNGNVLFGLTNGANWVPFTSGVSAANSSAGRVSRLPEDLECFNIESSSLEGVRFYRNSGLHTGSKNQILGAIMNLGNWSAPSNDNCLSTTENFSPSANDNAVGKPFTITPSNPDGTWTGFTDTDWFKCSNWEGLAVPKPITDVIIPNVVNQPIIGASPAKFPTGAFSNNLTVNNGSSLTMNTAASRLNLYGNWTNDAGNAAFVEGNGTVHFTGTNPQIINNVTPLGTEVFYNVVLNNNFTTAVSNDLIASGNLTVNTGRIVNVSPDDYIQVNENLINNGTFTVFNNGSLVQVNDLGVNTGTITYQRTAMARNLDYVYWSSPVAAFNVNNLPNNYRYIWNTTIANTNGGQGNWEAASGNMVAGKGYIARASNGSATPIATTTSFVGVPNNGVVNMPILRGSYQGDDYPGTNEITITRFSDNWNLVGNPYPSAINVDEFLDLNANIEGAIRIWTHGTLPSSLINNPFYGSYQANYTPDDYITHNGVGTVSGPIGFNGFLAGGQGFMVNMLDGAAGGDNLIFKNSLRNKSYNNSQFYRTSGVSNIASVEKNRIWLDLINNSNNAAKRTLIGYVGNATNDKDRLYDAFTPVGTTMHIYSIIANDKMTIQGRQLPFDANDKVNLGYFVPASGNYSIGIAALDGLFASGQNIYLEDKLLGIIHDLRSNPYSFSANAGEVNNRFVLRYTNETLGNDDFITSSDVLISSSDVISVNAMSRTIQNVKIYNVLGQLLLDADTVNSNTFETSKLQKNNTTLLVQVTLENGAKVTKKIVF